MKGKIICYNIKSSNILRSDMDRFLREFAGHDDKSNYGKYSYRKRGLLDNIPHIKPVRSVIIVSSNESAPIIDLLRSYKINTYIRDIILTKEDVDRLKPITKQSQDEAKKHA